MYLVGSGLLRHYMTHLEKMIRYLFHNFYDLSIVIDFKCIYQSSNLVVITSNFHSMIYDRIDNGPMSVYSITTGGLRVETCNKNKSLIF